MRLHSNITVSMTTMHAGMCGSQCAVAGEKIFTFQVTEEPGDHDCLQFGKTFDAVIGTSYVYGAHPTSCDCVPDMRFGNVRVWSCTSTGLRHVPPGTSIFAARKSTAMEAAAKEATTAGILYGSGLPGSGVINTGCCA